VFVLVGPQICEVLRQFGGEGVLKFTRFARLPARRRRISRWTNFKWFVRTLMCSRGLQLFMATGLWISVTTLLFQQSQLFVAAAALGCLPVTDALAAGHGGGHGGGGHAMGGHATGGHAMGGHARGGGGRHFAGRRGYGGGYAYGGNCNGYYGNYGYNNGCGYNPAGAIAGGLIGGAMNSFGAYWIKMRGKPGRLSSFPRELDS
jgi:hypothetical protein